MAETCSPGPEGRCWDSVVVCYTFCVAPFPPVIRLPGEMVQTGGISGYKAKIKMKVNKKYSFPATLITF